MTIHNVISLADTVAADENNRQIIQEFLSHRDGINAFRAYPDGRDIGAVPQSDGDIIQGIDQELASMLRTGELEGLDRDTYDAWLEAIDDGHEVSLIGFNIEEFDQKLEQDAARAERQARIDRQRATSVAAGLDENSGAEAVKKLRAAMKEADAKPPTWSERLGAGLAKITGLGPKNQELDGNTHD